MEATFLSILWKVLFAAISIIGFYTVFCWFKMSDQEVCPEKVSLSTFVVLAKSECHRLMPENDYSKRLRQLPLANIETYFVSPSEFQFINQSTLTSHLLSPERWSGLILTSTRCIDAIVHLWQSIPEEQRKQWASKEIFTVGKSTRDYLLLKLNLDSIGYESGNSQLLAEFIANRDRIRPLLYPCSCIRSETLGTVLTGMVEEVACYETIANRRISEDLAELKVELAKFDPTNLTVIIVFFSPSGVKHLLEPLQNLVLPSLVESTVKYVAFGKQTQDRMLHSGLEVWFVSSAPNAEALANDFYLHYSL